MIESCRLLKIEQDIHDCKNCDLAGKLNPNPFSQYVDYSKIKEARFMFVGRNPGLEDTYTSTDFLSYRQKYHDNFVNSNMGKYLISCVGLDTFSMYSVFTNVLKCSTPKNIEPNLAQYSKCMPHFINQMEAFNPKVIYAFGRSVVRSLSIAVGDLGYPTVHGKYKGYFGFIDIIGREGETLRRIISLYHPSFFMRGGGKDIEQRQRELLKEECTCP